MVDGFKGETVSIVDVVETRKDKFNAPIYETVLRDAPDTLVAPGSQKDIINSTRPDGVEIAYTLYFLGGVDVRRNQSIIVRGETCKVVGNPDRYSPGNVPTSYDLVVEVSASDG